MPTSPETIFFDVGNTLLFPDRDHILKPLKERGHSPALDHWHAVERATKRTFDRVMQERDPADFNFWFLFFERLLDDLAVRDEHVHHALVEAIRQSANWCVIPPGTRELLHRLGARYRLAVISNADGKIEDVLKRC